MNASALVKLLNGQLALYGTGFELSREMPLGPLGVSLFGSIKGFPVRLDFIVNPADDRRAVTVFDLRTRQPLAERPPVSTFPDAISEYPWPAVMAALTLH